jgi:hypothetical protein
MEPGIRVFVTTCKKTWMAGTSPAMTTGAGAAVTPQLSQLQGIMSII